VPLVHLGSLFGFRNKTYVNEIPGAESVRVCLSFCKAFPYCSRNSEPTWVRCLLLAYLYYGHLVGVTEYSSEEYL